MAIGGMILSWGELVDYIIREAGLKPARKEKVK